MSEPDTMELPTGRIRGKTLAVVKGREEGKIGILLFFSFGSMEVPVEETAKFWKGQELLDEWLKPNEPTASDAFMLTCSQENVAIWEKIDSDTIEEYEKLTGDKVRVEYVSLPTRDGNNEYILIRRVWVVEKTKKKKGKKVIEEETKREISPEHNRVARLKYSKDSDEVVVVPFPEYKNTDIVEAIQKVANEEFRHQKKVINRTKHAQAFYRLVREVGGVPFGYGGGVVFVPPDGVKKVEMFRKYITTVASKYRTTSHLTGMFKNDVFDEGDIKKEIARCVAQEVSDQYKKVLESTLEYIQKQEWPSDPEKRTKAETRVEEILNSKIEEAGRIGVLKEKYEQLLDSKIRVERAKMEIPTNVEGRVLAALKKLDRALSG